MCGICSCYCALLVFFVRVRVRCIGPVRCYGSCHLLLFLLLLVLSFLVVAIVRGGGRVLVAVPRELFLLCGIFLFTALMSFSCYLLFSV